MSIDNQLDKLKKIRQVEAPPFLFTRIREKINSLTERSAPVKWQLSFVAIAILLIVLNTEIIVRSSRTTDNSAVDQVVNSMQLSSSNDLYHE